MYSKEQIEEIKRLRRFRASGDDQELPLDEEEDQELRVPSKYIHADKHEKERIKRKLGIQDSDQFIDNKIRKQDWNKPRSIRQLYEEEYSDDEKNEDESGDTVIRKVDTIDSWLREVDAGQEAFKSEEDRDKALQAKAKILEEQERRNLERVGINLATADRVLLLVELLTSDHQTPSDLMCNIKQQAIQRLEPQDRSKKPSVNRAVRLPADLQVKMNEVVEICDLLMMDEGLNVYPEPKANLQLLYKKLKQKTTHPAETWWRFKVENQESKVLKPSEVKELMSDHKNVKAQVIQVDEYGQPLPNCIWIPADSLEFELDR